MKHKPQCLMLADEPPVIQEICAKCGENWPCFAEKKRQAKEERREAKEIFPEDISKLKVLVRELEDRMYVQERLMYQGVLIALNQAFPQELHVSTTQKTDETDAITTPVKVISELSIEVLIQLPDGSEQRYLNGRLIDVTRSDD